MRPEDLLYWLKAQPFRPFRITLVNGESYEVRHPEFVKLMKTSLVYFTPSSDPDVFERGTMLGLLLIQKIEPIEAATAAA